MKMNRRSRTFLLKEMNFEIILECAGYEVYFFILMGVRVPLLFINIIITERKLIKIINCGFVFVVIIKVVFRKHLVDRYLLHV